MSGWGKGSGAPGRPRRPRRVAFATTAIFASLAAFGASIAPSANAADSWSLLSFFMPSTTKPTTPATTTPTATPPSTSPFVKEPVLVVCGYHDLNKPDGCSSSIEPLITHLRRNGFDAYGVDTSRSNDIVVNAESIRQKVASVLARPQYASAGVQRVALVGHSQGGIAARYYIATGGAPSVRRYIALGTGQYGASQACDIYGFFKAFGQDDVGLKQMCSPKGDYDGADPVLQKLNGRRRGGSNGGGVDDTPNGVMPWAYQAACNPDSFARACKNDGVDPHIEYYSIWLDPGDTGMMSWDYPIWMPSSHKLDGGACYEQVTNLSVTFAVPFVDHTEEPNRNELQRRTVQALKGVCEGVPTYTAW